MIGRGHRGRTDQNHKGIVAAFRKHGVKVRSLAQLGDGMPDLLCQFRGGKLALVEVKKPGGKLTPDQVRFIEQGWEVHVVASEADVEELVTYGKVTW